MARVHCVVHRLEHLRDAQIVLGPILHVEALELVTLASAQAVKRACVARRVCESQIVAGQSVFEC